MKKSMWIAAVAVVGTLVVASCGGSSSSSSESAYVAALSKSIATENAFGGGAESADCLAKGIVKTIGVKLLEQSNVQPEDFASAANLNLSGVGEKKLDEIVDYLLDNKCVDLAKQLAASMRAQAGNAITEEQANCVASKLVKHDSFRRGFRASLTGSGDAASQADTAALSGFMSECGVSAGGTAG